MTKPFNTMLILMLTALFTAGCQSTQNNSNQITDNNRSNSKQQTKDFNQQIEGKYWKLMELEGQPVDMADNQQSEIHFKLSDDENKVNGFAGCNNFFGTYELEQDKMRIKFSSMATTMMACPDMVVDDRALLEVLDLTDNYSIFKDNDDNDMLTLNVGRRAPLAVFTAVYFD